jgi:hypothetical protein
MRRMKLTDCELVLDNKDGHVELTIESKADDRRRIAVGKFERGSADVLREMFRQVAV